MIILYHAFRIRQGEGAPEAPIYDLRFTIYDYELENSRALRVFVLTRGRRDGNLNTRWAPYHGVATILRGSSLGGRIRGTSA